LELLHAGERLSKEVKDSKNLAIFSSDLGAYYSIRENAILGTEYAEKCFQEAEKLQDSELMVRSALDLCLAHFASGQALKLCDVARKVISLLEGTDKEREYFGRPFNPYSSVLGWYGWSLGELGEFEKGMAMLNKGLRCASEINARVSSSFIESMFGFLLLTKGDAENAIEHFEKGLKYAKETSHLSSLGYQRCGLGQGYYYKRDLASAKENIMNGLRIIEERELKFRYSSQIIALCRVYFDLGDLHTAQQLAEKALKISQEQGERDTEGYSMIWLGRILGKTHTSMSAKAEQYIIQGIEISDKLRGKPMIAEGYLHLGDLHIDIGKTEKAREDLHKADEMFRDMGMDYWLKKTQEALGRLGNQ
jgi:tetratricopeptide (TPR) repeat protein